MYGKFFGVFAFGFLMGHASASEAQQYGAPAPQPQQQVIIGRPVYVPPGGSIVQRPMGSDYSVTTPWCDPRYAAADDPCVPRPRR